jgi:error-prone DNA polymerase
MSFSGYSFCKPHSASYALVSFKSAWLRAHYPAEFMAAVISNQGGYYRTFAYVSEARRMGLEVSGPDINHSDEHYTGCGNKLRAGLMQIKGLSRAGLAGLLAERERAGPYQSFGDFLARARPSHADAELLVKAGCFDEVQGGESRPSLLWELWSYSGEKKERAARLPLVAESTPLPKPAGYDGPMILRQEEETLGFLLSRHPLELYLAELPPFSYVPACELPLWKGKRVTTLGWYVTGKLTESKKGEPMEFLSFEDTTAIYETTFFPKAYRRFCSLVGRERPYLLTGRVEEDFGAVTLTVDLVKPLSLPEHNRPSFVHASPAGGI